MARYGPTRSVRNGQKIPPFGHFATDKPELDWEKCRERFASNFNSSTKGFYFSHEQNRGEYIACFIDKVETILIEGSGVLLEKTEFGRTNLNFALWVAPSSFWSCCPMRRSLFTILLRSALNYDPCVDNFEQALYTDDTKNGQFAGETKEAIQRFLFGFTNYQGHTDVEGINKGWWTIFKNAKVEDIRKKLVKPDGRAAQVSLIGMGNLWSD
jgi:hypothetical protein